jgi:hypothetical protein
VDVVEFLGEDPLWVLGVSIASSGNIETLWAFGGLFLNVLEVLGNSKGDVSGGEGGDREIVRGTRLRGLLRRLFRIVGLGGHYLRRVSRNQR